MLKFQITRKSENLYVNTLGFDSYSHSKLQTLNNLLSAIFFILSLTLEFLPISSIAADRHCN